MPNIIATQAFPATRVPARPWPCRALATVAVAALLGTQPMAAAAQDLGAGGSDAVNWLDTWSASPQPDWGPDFFAPVGIPRSLRDQTIR